MRARKDLQTLMWRYDVLHQTQVIAEIYKCKLPLFHTVIILRDVAARSTFTHCGPDFKWMINLLCLLQVF